VPRELEAIDKRSILEKTSKSISNKLLKEVG